MKMLFIAVVFAAGKAGVKAMLRSCSSFIGTVISTLSA